MATKFEKKIGYNSACIRDISEICAFIGDFAIKLCNDVKEILKKPTQVAMATKFETKWAITPVSYTHLTLPTIYSV